MLHNIVKEHWARFRSDPRWAVKFIAITLALSALGKLMLVAADVSYSMSPATAQFVPMLPMFGLTFLAHRYLWGRRDVSLLSYIGGLWTSIYVSKYVVGHGMFTICTAVLGWEARWQYLTVSFAVGAAMAA